VQLLELSGSSRRARSQHRIKGFICIDGTVDITIHALRWLKVLPWPRRDDDDEKRSLVRSPDAGLEIVVTTGAGVVYSCVGERAGGRRGVMITVEIPGFGMVREPGGSPYATFIVRIAQPQQSWNVYRSGLAFRVSRSGVSAAAARTYAGRPERRVLLFAGAVGPAAQDTPRPAGLSAGADGGAP
jgi:hypothetical protein